MKNPRLGISFPLLGNVRGSYSWSPSGLRRPASLWWIAAFLLFVWWVQ